MCVCICVYMYIYISGAHELADYLRSIFWREMLWRRERDMTHDTDAMAEKIET